ncbi:hypothetical protein JXI42_06630 [bacterium]|nr:hypothetical protein [bacterium]
MKYVVVFAIMLEIFFCVNPGFSQTAEMKCYETKKVQLILRFEKNNKVLPFFTFVDWHKDVKDTTLLNNDFKWFARTGKGEELNDAELLAYLGREKEAKKISELWESDRKKAATQLALGIPLGLAMIIGGISWNSKLNDDPSSSLPEKGAAITISLAGVGVITGVTLNFLRSRERSSTKHKITSHQTLDMVDRYNRALKMKCGVEN